MKQRMLLALMILSLAACDRPRTVTQTNVASNSYLLDSSAFDLGTLTELVRANRVSNAESMEKLVNDPSSGINNVDLDNDGNIDYVAVVENSPGKLDFVAYPATRAEVGATTIAQLSITTNTSTNQIVVSGGYPSYVCGYDRHYYSYYVSGPSLGQYLFLNYMLNSSRPRYYHPYSYYSTLPSFAVRHHVYAPAVLTTRRVAYTKTVQIKPATVVSRPKTYTIQSAQKTTSSLATKKPAPTSTKLNDRSGTMKSFTKRSSTKAKATGSAFNQKKVEPAKTTPSKPAPAKVTPSKPAPSKSWGSGSGSKTPSKSWGSGSGSKTPSKSWGSGSGSRSTWSTPKKK